MSRQQAAAPQPQSAGTVNGPLLQRACACGQHAPGGGECESCKQKRQSLQRSAVRDSAPDLAPPIVHDVLRSPGQPLDEATRGQMESRFGQDFSRVRVHTDGRAAASAQAVNALAYTVGSNVVFASGQYAPEASSGQRLLAHELTHVVQQPAGLPGADLAVSPANDRFEAEAQRAGQQAADISRLPGAALQRQPAGGAATCATNAPENCAIYEDWIRQFSGLPAFIPRDTTRNTTQTGASTANPTGVLGGGAATGTTPPPAPVSPNPADHFIDRPTQAWVDQHFNEELRTMAYQLPADCADIAVVLRHVWLFAHQRSETYRDWNVGFQLRETGAARARRIRGLIRNTVSSANVAEMVNQYSDEQGRPLRSFRQDLQHVLHPGDVLVIDRRWDRMDGPRASGHTLTIESIQRNEQTGEVTSITALQGNQPLSPGNAEDIREQQREAGEAQTSVRALREAPGRRIERSTWSGSRLSDINGVWAYQDSVDGRTRFNIFIAAGPPRAATLPGRRPGPRSPGRLGRPTDWLPALRRAARAALQPTFEAALQSARSFLEGGRPFSLAEARSLGQAAGERLWSLAHNRGLGYEEHFQPLHELRQVLAAMRRTTRGTPGVQEAFDAIDEGLRLGVRGVTTIDFQRQGRRSERLFNVLLMGFDPFFTDPASGTMPAPRPGEWNPSGAAVMALDGARVAGDQAAAAVEGVVLPVSYQAFRGGSGREGIVEHVLGPRLNQLDAVLTVSQDPGLDRDLQNPDEPVRIESQAVGVHNLRPIQTHQDLPAEGTAFGLERVPPGTGATGNANAPLILSTSGVDLPALAGETAQAGRGRRLPVAAPDVSDTLTLGFNSEADASRARQALNLAPQNIYHIQSVRQPPAAPLRPGGEVRPNRTYYTAKFDGAALAQILSTMQNAGGVDITFEGLQGQRLRAAVLSGPGGSFLSNEVSYRTRRALRGASGGRDPVTFHVHTPRGGIVPPAGTPPPARGVTTPRAASRRRSVVIQTLRRMIQALVGQLARRRTGSTP